MTKRTKIRLLGGSLTVVAALAMVPAAQGLAATGSEPEAGPDTCTAIVDDLRSSSTGLADQLAAVPPDVAGAPKLANELLGLVTGLVGTGCLPTPELPVPENAERAGSGVAIPLPTLPPVEPGLPTVPVCVDLTADLLDAVTGVLASLLSTSLPDLTGALEALTGLVDTLTGITDEGCLPAAPVTS